MSGKRPISVEEASFVVLPAATGGGAAKLVERFELVGATIQLVMSSGTVVVEGSNDGVVFEEVVAAQTADGISALAENYKYLRINTTVQPTDCVASLFAHELIY